MTRIWAEDEVYNNGYTNYGDVDFFEYGTLVNTEHSNTVFPMMICRPYSDEEDSYQFGNIEVDINDTWIDRNAVERYADVDKDKDPVQYAIACVDYYGIEEFGAFNTYPMTRKDIEEIMQSNGIDLDSYKTEKRKMPADVVYAEKAIGDYYDAALELITSTGFADRVKYVDQAMEAAGRLFGGKIEVYDYVRAENMIEETLRGISLPLTRKSAQYIVDNLAAGLSGKDMFPANAELKAFREYCFEKYNQAVRAAGGEAVRCRDFYAGPYRHPESGIVGLLNSDERKMYMADPLVKTGDIYRNMDEKAQERGRSL